MNDDAKSYVRTHITRLQKTLAITPPGGPDQRILEMGAYLQITPALKTKLGYGEVRGCYYGTPGEVESKEIESENGERFTCEVDLFDAERDLFPYPDEHFDTVLCGELIEHLPTDPMHMMSEVNRILKPGGHFVLTTPNICSMRAISAILQGYHPGFFPAYIRPAEADTGARHAREYAPREIVHLFRDAGFEVALLETGEFRDEPHPEHEWVRHLLEHYKAGADLRGDGIYAVGVKRGPVRERFPRVVVQLTYMRERPQVELDAETRTAQVRVQAPNGASTVGYQIFDPDSGTFIFEGEWKRVVDGSADVRIELPPERGRYHIYVSPIDEKRGWDYDKGKRFLLIDASVENGRARLLDTGVTTIRALRRRNYAGAFVRIFTLPVLSIWRNRSLLRSMVRRDVMARYRGSFGDVFWTVLNPLLLMVTYFFVFGIVLESRFGPDGSRTGFALYFLAGMLPWLPFAEAAGRAPNSMIEHRTFIKKLVFPVEILPVTQTIAALVTQAFALAVFVIGLFIIRGDVPTYALWLPVLLVPQVLFTLGATWFLSALGVFVRDLGQVIGFLLTLWFFITPICYPEQSLPKEIAPILMKNPIYVLVRGYRDLLLESRLLEWGAVWKLWLVAVFVFFAGHAWFHKLRKSFADVI